MEDQTEVTCPQCNTNAVVKFWQTVNVSLDASLRDTLLEGKLNVVRCEHCGFTGALNCPLLYHDMTKRFCVQYYPSDILKDPAEHLTVFRGITRDGELQIPPAFSGHQHVEYLSKPHIVFDMNEMVRYVVFRELLWTLHEEGAASGE